MAKKQILENEVVDVDESAASETLHAGGGSGGTQGGFGRLTKSELLGKMMKLGAQMTKQDLSVFLVKTLDQVGHETDGQPSTAEKNKASVATGGVQTPSPITAKTVKEDVDELFDGQDELSEEFRTKVSTLFEAAVSNRVMLEVARLEEEMETKLDEQVTEAIDELHEQVNKYTDYVAAEWMKENQAVLEQSYRSQATEDFIEGLKGLFKEHYVEVPEDRLDVIGELEEKVNALEKSLNEAKAANIELTSKLEEGKVVEAFATVADGLADTQVEKLRTLAEGIEYKTIEDYTDKLTLIKGQYFTEEKKKEVKATGIINEESLGNNDDDQHEVVIPADMKSYYSAISRTVKK